MYLQHYGLSDFPFQLTPDHRFFFESTVHRKAMSHLLFGLNQAEGFIIITGEVGAGKTTLLGQLLDTLGGDYLTGTLVSTRLSGDDLLRGVAAAFHLAHYGLDKATLLERIRDFLTDSFNLGRRVLLLVDEAQNVPAPALEELRMLSNFQVGNKVPLQSILLAQPQLRHTLARADLEQFRQRIVASYHLGSMQAVETRDYIRHRLKVVGWRNDPDFTEEALADIFHQTGGIPRKINTFCSRLMMFCFLDDLHRIDRDEVASVAEDMRHELGAVLDSRDDDGTAGFLSSQGDGNAGLLGDDLEMVLSRIETLERKVDRHNRALRQLTHLGETRGPRGPFD